LPTTGGTLSGQLTINSATGQKPLIAQVNGTEVFEVDASGNVGIGTASPSGKLDVNATSGKYISMGGKSSASASADLNVSRTSSSTSVAQAPNIYFDDGTIQNTTLIQSGAGNLQFWSFAGSSWNERMRIDTSGNVGIGTNSPSRKLDVVVAAGGSVGLTGSDTLMTNNVSTTNGSWTQWYKDNTVSYVASIGTSVGGNTAKASAMIFADYQAGSWAERMRIDSSGNLLVGGQTSSITPYALLQVRGDNKGISIQDTTDNSYRAIYNQSGSLYFYNGSNEGYLSTAGAWINASDAKLKNSIVDIKHGLSSVLNTKPRSYKMNGLDGDYIGFVAQELQPVIPEVVSQSDKQLGVDYGSLVAVAFKAIQEQQAIIQTLTDRITALENK
jgi:hypothetical protein